MSIPYALLRSTVNFFTVKLLTTEPKPSENELNLNLVVLEPKPNHTLPYKELNRTQMSCFLLISVTEVMFFHTFHSNLGILLHLG